MNAKLSLLLWGRFLGGLGIQLLLLAGGFAIFQKTQSAFLTGLTGFFLFIPSVLFTFFCGSLVDRLTKVGSFYVLLQTLFFLVAVLCLISPSVSLIYVIFFLASTLRSFRAPFFYTLIKIHSGAHSSKEVARWMTYSWQIPLILGPLLFSLVSKVAGASSCLAIFFLGAAALFSVSFYGETKLPRPQGQNVAVPKSPARDLWLKASRDDLLVMGLLSFSAVLPFLLQQKGLDPASLGYFRAALSAGSLLCAGFFGRKSAGLADHHLFATSLVLSCLVVFAVSLTGSFFPLIALCFAFGFLDGFSILYRESLLISACSVNNAGKTSSLSQIFNSFSEDGGDFRSGAVTQWLGAERGLQACAVGGLLVCGILFRNRIPSKAHAEARAH